MSSGVISIVVGAFATAAGVFAIVSGMTRLRMSSERRGTLVGYSQASHAVDGRREPIAVEVRDVQAQEYETQSPDGNWHLLMHMSLPPAGWPVRTVGVPHAPGAVDPLR